MRAEPVVVDAKKIATIANEIGYVQDVERFCFHFHLPSQSDHVGIFGEPK